MVKLRDCGLVSALVEGKWHRHVLRGGSMAAAARLVSAEAMGSAVNSPRSTVTRDR